jgi:peptide/nickel transport system permease protein
VTRRIGLTLAIAWLGLAVAISLLAPLLTSHDPLQPVAPPISGSRPGLPLGSDSLGRDLWSRLAYGGRVTLGAAFLATGLAVLAGATAGLVAAAFGGWADRGIVTAVNASMAIPGLVLAMLFVAGLGPNLTAVVLAVGLGAAPGFARLSRTTFQQIRDRGYVAASSALGAGRLWTARRHMIPNARASLSTLAATHFAWAVLGITTLTFLGLAGDPSLPEWGAMLNSGRQHLLDAPRLALLPGAAIALTVLAVYNLGGGSVDARRSS